MTDPSDYTVTVTGPGGEVLHTHSSPITAEYRQQAIREFLEGLAADRPDGSYFILARDADHNPALLDVSEMVRDAVSNDHAREKLLVESREWLATMRSRWSPPKDSAERRALTRLIESIGAALGAGEGS